MLGVGRQLLPYAGLSAAAPPSRHEVKSQNFDCLLVGMRVRRTRVRRRRALLRGRPTRTVAASTHGLGHARSVLATADGAPPRGQRRRITGTVGTAARSHAPEVESVIAARSRAIAARCLCLSPRAALWSPPRATLKPRVFCVRLLGKASTPRASGQFAARAVGLAARVLSPRFVGYVFCHAPLMAMPSNNCIKRTGLDAGEIGRTLIQFVGLLAGQLMPGVGRQFLP